MKRTSHEKSNHVRSSLCPAEIIRPPNQRAKLAIGTALLLLLQLSATNALAAPTTIIHPDYTTPIIDPAGQRPAAGVAWANVIPNALMAAFTYTPYALGSAGANAFTAVDPTAKCGVVGAGGEDCYTITIQQATQQLGLIDNGTAGNPPLPTTIWGYGSATNAPATGPFTAGLWHAPAMTFKNTANRPARITWLNQLPNVAQPGFDPTYCGPSAPDCFPYNRIVTHVHGAHVPADSDGIPEAWYSANFANTGSIYKPSPYGPLGTYRYPMTQEGGTIWYHDHATGVTHLNTQMGMAGFFLITDDNEKCLQGLPPSVTGACGATTKALPTDPYEIGFALQDRTFWPNGNFALPDQPIRNLFSPACLIDPLTGLIIPTSCPTVPFSKAADGHLIPYSATAPQPGPFTATSGTLEYFGNIPMVNGVVYGKYDVEPRVYRMRFIGGTDSRTYVMQLVDRTTGAIIPFWQIGSEQGMLNNPVQRQSIDIMPGERIDVLVDLKAAVVGHKIVMKNLGPDMPYAGPYNVQPASIDIPEIMEFNVIALNGAVADVPSPTIALNLRPVNGAIAALTPTVGTAVRNVSLMEIQDQYGRTQPTVDSRGFMTMGMPPTEIVKLNDIEQWDIINTTVDAHPMHLHLVAFQVIDRQIFNPFTFGPPVSDTMNQIFSPPTYTNAVGSVPVLPDMWERGWKDTIDCPPGYVTRVKAKFDIEGAYVWHCHILSHEEHDMMRPMIVKKRRLNADFDGDGKTDIAFWNPTTFVWNVNASYAMAPYTVTYGTTGDKPVPGDYDGSGKNEIAVFRPSNGTWYIRNTDGTQSVVNYGATGDIPVPGDYDGDGKTDIAVYRPSNFTWYISNSATGTQTSLAYGAAGDTAVPGDYDGDGKTDIAIWRAGTWFIHNSLGGTQNIVIFGTVGDIPVPGDYDGDGKTDVAIYRPSTFTWFIKNSATGTQTVKVFGTTGDVPMPGDYSEIGRTDIAIWRPSTSSMYIIDSATGTQRIVASGSAATDLPVKSGQPIQ
jgi:FtsP/CotA-like multicopper oxidase with cupredoxin domain